MVWSLAWQVYTCTTNVLSKLKLTKPQYYIWCNTVWHLILRDIGTAVYIYKIWISKESVNYWIWLNTDFMLILIGISKDYRICTRVAQNLKNVSNHLSPSLLSVWGLMWVQKVKSKLPRHYVHIAKLVFILQGISPKNTKEILVF